MKAVLAPRSLIVVALVILLASCSAPVSYEGGAAGVTAEAGFAQAPPDRPGLGTKWGEERKSPAWGAHFERANPTQPLALAKIFYNDRAGIEAMANARLLRRTWPVLANPAASLVSVALRDEGGRLLPGVIVGDRWFVVGEEGRRYSIEVANRSDFRLEVVLSVDGLDALDGRPASLRNRGYVIDPHRTIRVDGFRQSYESVAAFRFGPVRESYAQENITTPAMSA